MRFHSRLEVWCLALAGIPALVRGQSPPPPSLGTAASFAVLGGSSVTSSGSTIITGNLGVSPGNSIIGSPTVKIGAIDRNDSIARQAQKDVAAAYKDVSSRACTNLGIVSGPLGHGVYCLSSQLPGTLVLDDPADPNPVWVFRIPNNLTTAAGSSVRVIHGRESNVFWQVGDSATLGSATAFVGNVLALKDITLNSGATVAGRLLAGGVVLLDNNNVSLCCDPITLSPATLHNGIVGTQYSPTMIIAGGGLAPYSFSSLPKPPVPGMTLSSGGVLAGTPATAGSYTFTVTATDSTGVCSGISDYTISISCPAITVTNPTGSSGPACVLFSQTFTSTGGVAPIAFSTDSTLPAGLDLDQSSGVLAGSPAEHGIFPIVVKATDANGCIGTGPSYQLEVTCPTITVTNPAIATGTIGTAFSQTFSQSGSVCPTVFSIRSGTLPTGLTLNPTTGCLQGTPTQTGSFLIVVRALSSSGCTGEGPPYPLVINCQTITVTNPINSTGTVNTPFSETFNQTGAIGGATFSLDSGPLPAGLTLHTSGVLDGTPTQSGIFPITIKVTDGNGCTGIGGPYELLINPSLCVLTLSPATLPSASPGVPYNEVITAGGGTPPYTFVITGPLPPGLLPTTTGATLTISGTPTTVGCFPFTITATDANGCSSSVDYTICVAVGGPTLSGWGMAVLAVLLVGIGWIAIRKGG
jgi:hypothetical protein